MYIGYMGSVVFIVSSHYMLTPTNLTQDTKGRWQDHDVIYKKPSSEFLGPGLRNLSFDIILSKMTVTQDVWRVDSMSVNNTYYDPVGKLIRAVVNVKLVEYDDSNYTEEQSKIGLYGSIANLIFSI